MDAETRAHALRRLTRLASLGLGVLAVTRKPCGGPRSGGRIRRDAGTFTKARVTVRGASGQTERARQDPVILPPERAPGLRRHLRPPLLGSPGPRPDGPGARSREGARSGRAAHTGKRTGLGPVPNAAGRTSTCPDWTGPQPRRTSPRSASSQTQRRTGPRGASPESTPAALLPLLPGSLPSFSE